MGLRRAGLRGFILKHMSRGVTMKTIAAQAGVTQATVSMSLANNPRIPEATRTRIQAIARRLGYRPNPYLSTLMRVRRRGRPLADRPVLALVNCLDGADTWRTTRAVTVRQMREGAIARATERGYRAQEFWLRQQGMSDARFSQMLYARGIQGLLLSPRAEGAPPPQLDWRHFAAVSLSVPLPDSTLATVCNDHYFSALQVVRECRRLGYRRPGLVVLGLHRERFHGRWEAGILASSLLVPGVTPAPALLLEGWQDQAALGAWLRRAKPDLVISPGAMALQPVLRELGWRVPQDLGLAALAVPALGSPIAGIYQNGALIGATAIDTLIGHLERNERGLPTQALTVMVEGVWNPGRTLRAVKE